MSAGFHANTLTLLLKNLTSTSSYLGSRLAPIRAVLLGSPSTSWITLCSLDLMFLRGASSSGISRWSAEVVSLCYFEAVILASISCVYVAPES